MAIDPKRLAFILNKTKKDTIVKQEDKTSPEIGAVSNPLIRAINKVKTQRETQKQAVTLKEESGLAGEEQQIPLSWTPSGRKETVKDTTNTIPDQPTIRLPYEQSWFDKLKEKATAYWPKDSKMASSAKAADILALADMTGQSVSVVEEHFEDLAESVGIKGRPLSTYELGSDIVKYAGQIGIGSLALQQLITNPVATVSAISKFMATKELSERAILPMAKMVYQGITDKKIEYEVTKISKLMPKGAVRDAASLAEFILYGKVAGKVFKINPKTLGVLNGLRYKIGKKLGGKFETLMILKDKSVKTGPSKSIPLTVDKAVSPGTGMVRQEYIASEKVNPLWRLAEKEEQILKGEEDFLLSSQNKGVGIIERWFKPADYLLRKLGLQRPMKIIRNNAQDTRIKLQVKKQQLDQWSSALKEDLVRRGVEPTKQRMQIEGAKVRGYMEGKMHMPKNPVTPAQRMAKSFRAETERMWKETNKTRREAGQPEIGKIENYLPHVVKEEILEYIASNEAPPKYITDIFTKMPTRSQFLAIAQSRKGVPESWLIKDPIKLMEYMYRVNYKYQGLQESFTRAEPYIKYLEGRAKAPEGLDPIRKSATQYWNRWVDNAIKRKPTDITENLNETMGGIVGAVLNRLPKKAQEKAKDKIFSGKISYDRGLNWLLGNMYSGALGARPKVVLRNYVQSSFDWGMYGTGPYMKGSKKYFTPEGKNILKESRIWRTRIPFEQAEDSTFGRLQKAGSAMYRGSDMHNTGKGLLTRYYYAKDNLGYSHKQAIDFADTDLPTTQWSYLREDMPEALRNVGGRSLFALNSWWMNFYGRMVPEIMSRTFKGVDINGRSVPMAERMSLLRFANIVGMLHAAKAGTKKLTGTTVDYTEQVHPRHFGVSPMFNAMIATTQLTNNIATGNFDRIEKNVNDIVRSSKLFIPFELAAEDIYDLLRGDKKLSQVLFYTDKDKKKNIPFKSFLSGSSLKKKKPGTSLLGGSGL